MGISLVKNPKILVEETVRSTAVGTSRISHPHRFLHYGFIRMWFGLAGVIRGCNIGHKDSLESPQTDVLYFLVNQVLYGKSL